MQSDHNRYKTRAKRLTAIKKTTKKHKTTMKRFKVTTKRQKMTT